MKTSFGTGRNKEDARLCVREAIGEAGSPQLIFFFSGEEHFSEYAAIIHELYPDALSIGCSTYCTFDAVTTENDVLDVMVVESGLVCAGGVIERADNFALSSAERVKECLDAVGIMENTVCVEFTVPYKRAEEFALMALNSVLLRDEIPVVGGTASHISAGANEMGTAYVALNGKVYPDGCVFALIHNLEGRILLYRENIYEPISGRELVVTKANSVTRTIMKFDGEAAAEVYAGELGVPVEDIPQYFFHYPVGRREGEDIFVTAIQDVGSGGSLKHLARVHEGTKVMVMKEGDYRKITLETIEKVKRDVPQASLVLMVNCLARTVLFEQENYMDEYRRQMAEAFSNLIGFSALGEQMGTKHFNHTLLLVVFE